ncbi:SDR family oxidoreductase [Lyngbya sp. PCC 8106]|uniref:SDR family NAD(P)-dependent oxidoreductase n=1 Tax=Lyngbya sp. (strain PCC 8106) TaxID=313612 RepID=UPI0000EA9A4A|nr:SDR family oxidoreductase [Lyngbya sp. PCC 8106]EAW34077.1 Short-chain dehydrogenase/reductase SDR [Lyngbya sp. PCC 8106]
MKTALITGASFGIGETFAQELASRQTNLVLVARSKDKLDGLAQQLQEKYQIQAEVIAKDLTEPGATQAVFDEVTQKGITIDLLINNAGFGDYGLFAERDLQKQVKMIQLNITALVELSHLFLTPMRQRRSGSIINVASIAAYQPIPYMSIYSATKAFVLHFSEALWEENKDAGLHILALCPGPTESNFFETAEFPSSLGSGNKKDLVPPEEVVRDALQALEKNQSTLVTGGFGNHIIANISRFVPRDMVVSLVGKQFKTPK